MSTPHSQAIRPRRRRAHEGMRKLVQECHISRDDLVQPLFVVDGKRQRQAIATMPGQYRLSIDQLLLEVGELSELGISAVALFPVIDHKLKTKDAAEALNPHGLFPTAIGELKRQFPHMLLITDVAMDPYSSDGHDGYLDEKTGKILNDETLEILAAMALVQAKAGADILGPSDMMDRRVEVIRQALDKSDFTDAAIMSYTAKYCSAFYGPFRDALDSAPRAGDKKTYQMNPANVREAVLEAQLDEREGADIIMVKPGLPYLDVLRELRSASTLPLASYNVSGEYAMIKAAAAGGMLDEARAVEEMLLCFKRAGADLIFTYFAKEQAQRICDQP